MEEKELAEKISNAIDFNLSQIFNEIDLKVKNITHLKAESLNSLPEQKQETRILIFSEIIIAGTTQKAVISFSKENALKMLDLIKGAPPGKTRLFSPAEMNSFKGVSVNLFKAFINSFNSVSGKKAELSEPEIIFSFSAFENEFLAGNTKGEGRLIEFNLTVGGTDIKGSMKFFAPIGILV